MVSRDIYDLDGKGAVAVYETYLIQLYMEKIIDKLPHLNHFHNSIQGPGIRSVFLFPACGKLPKLLLDIL